MTLNLKTIKTINDLEIILKSKTYDEIVTIVYTNIPLDKMCYNIPNQKYMMPIDFLKENIIRYYNSINL